MSTMLLVLQRLLARVEETGADHLTGPSNGSRRGNCEINHGVTIEKNTRTDPMIARIHR
jgi:hypothetical protein